MQEGKSGEGGGHTDAKCKNLTYFSVYITEATPSEGSFGSEREDEKIE